MVEAVRESYDGCRTEETQCAEQLCNDLQERIPPGLDNRAELRAGREERGPDGVVALLEETGPDERLEGFDAVPGFLGLRFGERADRDFSGVEPPVRSEIPTHI